MQTLLARLQKIRETQAASGDFLVTAGLETKTDPAAYVWDGLKRGADASHPFVVFQYTLAGAGSYEAGGALSALTPGTAFLAVVPSAHVYFLPRESPAWTFFFLLIRHPYAVQRLAETQKRSGPIRPLTESDPPMRRALALFEGMSLGTYRDSWAVESALFEFVFEYERHAQRLLYPEAEREALLDAVRRQVLSGAAGNVSAIAAAHGLSRCHFSRQFKAVTGLAPASWVRQVRMEEAVRRLLCSSDTLETVARTTGFADANHFCKVFRRQYHLSPGEFRRQMR